MATVNSGFIKVVSGGQTVLLAARSGAIQTVISELTATRLDRAVADLAGAGYAKNGCIRPVFSGTTPQTVDLTNTTSVPYAGDSSFGSFTHVKLLNDGAAAVTVAPGASNGATLPFASITLNPGDEFPFTFGTPVVVDGTHKTILMTPAASGSLVVTIGGA
jgi:hypothetical protein